MDSTVDTKIEKEITALLEKTGEVPGLFVTVCTSDSRVEATFECKESQIWFNIMCSKGLRAKPDYTLSIGHNDYGATTEESLPMEDEILINTLGDYISDKPNVIKARDLILRVWKVLYEWNQHFVQT